MVDQTQIVVEVIIKEVGGKDGVSSAYRVDILRMVASMPGGTEESKYKAINKAIAFLVVERGPADV